MEVVWHFIKEQEPPEEVVLLVTGPLGLDLAVKIEDNLYFKNGDDWSSANLEHWCFNTPTHWAEFSPPATIPAPANTDLENGDI